MSIEMMNMVWKRYPEGGGELILALKLADNAHDDGTHIFPSVATMAAMTRQSVRTVQYQLGKMRDAAWLLTVRPGRGGRGTAGYAAEYRINPEWIKGADFASLKLSTVSPQKGAKAAPNKSEKGCKTAQKRVQSDVENGATAIAPQPSVNHQEPSERAARKTRSSSALSTKAKKSKSKPPAPGSRLHPDWRPSAEQAQAARTAHGWDEKRIELEAQKFVLHWIAQPGDKGISADWGAVWEKWVLTHNPAFDRKGANSTAGGLEGEYAWFDTSSGIESQGESMGVQPRRGDEPMPDYLVRVAAASGRGPWIDHVLKDARKGNQQRYQQIVALFLERDLLPADFIG